MFPALFKAVFFVSISRQQCDSVNGHKCLLQASHLFDLSFFYFLYACAEIDVSNIKTKAEKVKQVNRFRVSYLSKNY